MLPHVCCPPPYRSGCHRCQLAIAQANAASLKISQNPSNGWAILAANAAAEAAQTAAEAAVIAATAASQAATAATMSRTDVGYGGSHMGLHCNVYGYPPPVPFPTRRMALRPDASWRKAPREEAWHGAVQDGYIGTVRSRPYKRQPGGSASKNRHPRHQWKAQATGDANAGQGVGGGKAKDGQSRRDSRRWYRPQQPKGKRTNQKQMRFQAGNSGVNRTTQTATDQGTQTYSPFKDVAFSATEEMIAKGYIEPEPELPEIFALTRKDSEDDEASFFPHALQDGAKSHWPPLLDRATTVSSVSSADRYSQDSDEDLAVTEDQSEEDTAKEDVILSDLAVEV